jgi:hypothetical protein
MFQQLGCEAAIGFIKARLTSTPAVRCAQIPAVRRGLGERVKSTLSRPSRSVRYGRRTPSSGRKHGKCQPLAMMVSRPFGQMMRATPGSRRAAAVESQLAA